jgi:peptide chain release factor 2
VRDFTEELDAVRQRVADARTYLRIEEARERLAQLETEAGRPDLWDDPDRARKVTGEMAGVRDDVTAWDGLDGQLSDLDTLDELGREEGDDSVEAEIDAGLADMRRRLGELELRALFAGEYDEKDALVSIQSGAGGTDAQDWAEMLLRMYTRWAERRGLAVEIDDVHHGQEAGISSATFIVKGRYAYGMLRAEHGVHRLVRISPFDANARRQTAFAALEVVPMLDDAIDEVDIDEKDLRIDTFRSSGAGGQHVNTTDSAVRITHLPTGVVVSCQNERSQIQNRARAMQILAAKLLERARQELDEKHRTIVGERRDVAWGSQIRSYVLAPYQMVKDLRSEHESGNPQAVLDGDLDPFIEAFLQWRRAQVDADA